MWYTRQSFEDRYGVPQFIMPIFNHEGALTNYMCLHGYSDEYREKDKSGQEVTRHSFVPLVTNVPASIIKLRYMASDLGAELEGLGAPAGRCGWKKACGLHQAAMTYCQLLCQLASHVRHLTIRAIRCAFLLRASIPMQER
jgi:hypothetical protein